MINCKNSLSFVHILMQIFLNSGENRQKQQIECEKIKLFTFFYYGSYHKFESLEKNSVRI